MHIHTWHHPVELNTSVGDYRIVASTEEAVIFLMKHWPIDAAGEFVLARNACLDALTRTEAADEARATFIAACERIGVHVLVPGADTQRRECKYGPSRSTLEAKPQGLATPILALAEVEEREPHRVPTSQRPRPYQGTKSTGTSPLPSPNVSAGKSSLGMV